MLQAGTLQFLSLLSKHNTKEWFDANRKLYEAAKQDMEQLAAALIATVGKTDTTLSHLKPKDCLFRINRDVRFSKDKSPYKTNMGLYMTMGGKKGNHAGYYFHCEPGKAFMAGGAWMPMPADLKNIRQEIDYNWQEFNGIIGSKKFVQVFGGLQKTDSLSRPPKGYEEDNPAIEYLKLKSFIATAPLADTDLTDKTLVKKLASGFAQLQPLIEFLNKGLEG